MTFLIRNFSKIGWLGVLFLFTGLATIATPYAYATLAGLKHTAAPLLKATHSSSGHAPSTLTFIENAGQWNEKVRFQADIPQGTLFVTDDALWVSIAQIPDYEACRQNAPMEGRDGTCLKRGVNLRLSFVNANRGVALYGLDRKTNNISYFMGDEKDYWQTEVPTWEGVRYENLYPGLDLVLTQKGTQPVFQWVVQDANRARLEQVQLRVEGADSFTTDDSTLWIQTAVGQVAVPLFEVVTPDSLPIRNIPLPQMRDTLLTTPFRITSTPTTTSVFLSEAPLPSNLFASTFLGGSHYDYGHDIARDAQGNVYVFGETISVDFPTTPGAWQTTSPSKPPYYNLFISKFSPDLSQLLASTYLGGTGDEYAEKITVDAQGSVYLTGHHRSGNFPTTEHTWSVPSGSSTAYVVKMNSTLNSLIYVVFLGGSDSDVGYDIVVDANGAAYVAGTTRSPDFLVTEGAFDTVLNSPPNPSDYNDGFVVKIKPDGSWMAYSTFLGGDYPDVLYGIDIDATGHAYVTGTARSEDYPTTPDAFAPQSGGLVEGVVTQLNPEGSALIYSTYLGGSGLFDKPAAITVDTQGYAYVTGSTESDNFPVTEGTYDTLCGYSGPCRNPEDGTPESDGFLTKLNQDGSALVYSTYFGKLGADKGTDLAIDARGNAYVLSYIYLPPADMTPGAYNRRGDTSGAQALLQFNATGTTLLHGTYYLSDNTRLALADENWLYTIGSTIQPGFPTPSNAYDRTCGTDGNCNYTDRDGTGGIFYSDATVSGIVLPPAALTVTLGVEGGTLASGEDQIAYTFPANTFTDTVVFTHAPRHPLSMPPVVALAHVNRAFANYAVLSDTATLVSPTQPYSLSITYDEGDLTTDEATLALYYWEGGAWVVEPTGVLDTATNTITAQPDRVGWWAVLGEAWRLFLPLVVRE